VKPTRVWVGYRFHHGSLTSIFFHGSSGYGFIICTCMTTSAFYVVFVNVKGTCCWKPAILCKYSIRLFSCFIPFMISVLFSAFKPTDLFLVLPFMATRHLPTHAQTFVSHCLQNIWFCFRFFSSYVYSYLQGNAVYSPARHPCFSPQSFIPVA
jgi:hypothetical protein